MERSLKSRIALVTGAGKRIGKAIALELASAGCDVVVHVNRSKEEGEAVAAEIRSMGRRAMVVVLDQRDTEAIRRCAAEVEEQFGIVTILVNSAAIWPKKPLEETEEADFDEVMEANLRGPFFWARYFGPRMKPAGGGCIVNIADINAHKPSVSAIPYACSKAGVVTMTYGLARALAPEVRVNAIGPGPMIFPDGYSEEKKARETDLTLLKRPGTPEDIARAVRFFAENDYITGAFLPVDGGFRYGI